MPITNVIAFDERSFAASVIQTNQIYAGTGSNVEYPQTVGGITHGFISSSSGQAVGAAPGWQSGDSALVRGILRIQNTSPVTFRVDTGSGALDLMLVAGGNTFQKTRVRVYDGPTSGTLLTSFETQWTGDAPPTWPTAGWDRKYVDFTTVGTDPTVQRASSVDPVANAFRRQITVTQGYISVMLGSHSVGTDRSDLSAIGWGLQVSAPTLSTVAPTSGPVGTQITITGTNIAGTSAVTVNGTACTGIINDSATQVRATVGAGTTTGVIALTATAGSVTSGVTFTVTPTLVANAFRIVPGSLPASPVAGTPYSFQVEAIDTTQGNARVTSYNSASIVVGLDAALPDGLVVISGDADEPMVSGLASFTLTFAYVLVARGTSFLLALT